MMEGGFLKRGLFMRILFSLLLRTGIKISGIAHWGGFFLSALCLSGGRSCQFV